MEATLSAHVIDFPARPHGVDTAPARPSRFAASVAASSIAPGPRRYRFADMVRLLALGDLAVATQIARLRLLARTACLPLPLNPRQWRGQLVLGAGAICRASQWDAATVDAWLHQPGPTSPAIAAAAPSPAFGDVHAELRARARRLTA